MSAPALARAFRVQQWTRAAPTTHVRLASSQPPAARPYKPIDRNGTKQRPPQPPPADVQPRTGILRYVWPFSKGVRSTTPPHLQQQQQPREAPDPSRGQKAAERVVQTGQLDARYKDAARRVTAIICALPLVIYLGYELFRRRFEGVEKKPLPRPKSGDEKGEGSGEKQGLR